MLWLALRSALVFALARIVTLAMRRKSASMRHLVWLAAFVAVAAMPLFASLTPLAKVEPPRVTLRVIAPSPQPAAPVGHAEPMARSDAAIGAASEPYDVVAETYVAGILAEPYRLLPILYALGVGLLLLRYALAFGRLGRAILRSQRGEDLPGGIRVRTVEAGLLASPATFGWPRATVLMPAESETWPEDRRQAAIQHELAHIERLDWVWQCLALAVCTAQWFNPLAWFAVSRLRAEAEGAADDAVLRKGLTASAYAQELLEVAKGIQRDTLLAVPIARPGGVAHRVRAILARDRDRSATRRSVQVAAGTGTLLCAATLGGIGLGAAAAGAPLGQGGPFSLGTSSPSSYSMYTGSSLSLPDGALGLVRIQDRPHSGRARGWDSIGRPVGVSPSMFPLAPQAPGSKVREFVIETPPTRMVGAQLPKGAEVLQVTRLRKWAIVSVLFPADAQATRIKLGIASPANSAIEDLPIKPTASPWAASTSKLRWFTVPFEPKGAIYGITDEKGKTVPVLGQVTRLNSRETLIGIDATRGTMIERIEKIAAAYDWHEFGPVVLDPVRLPSPRPDAPVPIVDLSGGGKLSILRIEGITPGMPYEVWATDGGAPRKVESPSAGFLGIAAKPSLVRQVSTELRWPKPPIDTPSITWKFGKDTDSRGSSVQGAGNGVSATFSFDAPTNAKAVSVRMGYAYERWRLRREEPVGGSVLRTRINVDGGSLYNNQPQLAVEYRPSPEIDAMDFKLETLDAAGRPLAYQWVSGPGTSNGVRDSLRKFYFENKPGRKVAKVRLWVRPLYWVDLPPLPNHPR